jgi:hypothetical protein
VLFIRPLGAVLKRGALVAAANWPVALIQAAADGLFKLVVAAPLVGGVLLVTIVIGADTHPLDTFDWRVLLAELVNSLLAHRLVLAAFLLALAVAIVGASVFVFVIKAGTVGVLVHGDRLLAGVNDTSPDVVTAASAFSIERFVGSARALYPRYVRLGFLLMAVYIASAALYLAVAWASQASGGPWWITTLVIVVFFAWIMIVNLLYLLIQVIIAADDCGVTPAVRRLMSFLRSERQLIGGVFGIVMGMIALATGASLLAFTALGLVLLVPIAWLAAIPLQLVALVLRALVFEYIGLSSVGAYLALYRTFSERIATSSPVAQAVALQIAHGEHLIEK